MKKRIFTRFIAVAITLVMMMSLFAPIVSAANWTHDGHTHEKDEINYVSLGDSMTNGYGLDGYGGWTGVYDYGYDTYPMQFEKWLEDTYFSGDSQKVNHAQLALSGMRAEDLHWLLEFDYTDEDAIEIANRCLKIEQWKEYGEADWNAKFTTGDYWTNREFMNNRLAEAAYTIQNGLSNPNYDQVSSDAAKIAGEHYQNAIKDADIISLALGNGNFGVFMFGRVLESVGFDGGTPADAVVYDVERALAELSPELQEQALGLIDDLYAAVESYMGIKLDDGDDENTNSMEAIANTVVYTAVSFALNYAGSVDAMLKLNPDAEIILVGLMNTLKDDGTEVEGTSLGGLLDKVYEPLNAFIAGLPTYMQATGSSVYADATFYYAEAPYVEALSETYETEMKKGDSKIRSRFVSDIVGTSSNPGMAWQLISTLQIGGVTPVFVTLEDINAYDADSMTDVEKAEMIIDESTRAKAISCAIYLAFEKAIIEAGKGAPITIESIMGLGAGLDGSLFEGVMNDFAEKSEIKGESYETAMYDYLVGVAVETFENELEGEGYDGVLSAEDIEALIRNEKQVSDFASQIEGTIKDKMADSDEVKAILYATGHESVDAIISCDDPLHVEFCQGVASEFNTRKDEAMQMLTVGVNTAKGTIDVGLPLLCTALSVPEALSEALVADEAINSLLALLARCSLASGIGSHPSTDGHAALFEAVKTSYEDGHTAQDEIIEAILPILNKYYVPKYAELKANGSIDALKTQISGIREAIFVELFALENLKVSAELEDLKLLLFDELSVTVDTLDKIVSILNTDTLDTDTWATVIALGDDLAEHVENVTAIANELGVIAEPYLANVIDAAKYYSAFVDEIATDAYEAIVLEVEAFKELYLEFADITCEQVGKISPVLAGAVREMLLDMPKDALAILYAYGDDVVVKLCISATDASGDLYDAVVTLAALTKEYGWDIYNAIKRTPEYKTAAGEVKALSAKLDALYEEAKKSPFSLALTYEQKIAELKADIETAYDSLYELALAAIREADPKVALMLEDALDNVQESVNGLINIGGEYGEWFMLRTGDMLGDLLESVVEHSENSASVTADFIFDILADFGEYVDNIVADIELIIKIELDGLSTSLDELKKTLYGEEDEDTELLDNREQSEFMSYSFRTLADGASSADEDDRTIGDALDDLGDLVVSEIEERVAALEKKIAELQAVLEDGLIRSVAKIESMTDEILRDVDEIVAYLNAEGPVLFEKTIIDLTEAAESLKASGIEIISAVRDHLTAKIEEILARTLCFDYNVSDDSNYLAIGNFAQKENYATILANRLGGIKKTTFDNSGYRLADLRALLDEDFVNDAYGNQYFSKIKAKSRNTLIEDMKAADVITVDLGMADFTSFATNQVMAKVVSELDELKGVFEQFSPGYFDSYVMYDMDWSYFGEFAEDIDVAAAVDYIFEEYLDAYLPETIDIRDLVDFGITIGVSCEVPVKEVGRYAVEVCLYALANYAYNYVATVEAIQAVNPDAQVVMIGSYNMLDGFVLEIEDLTLDMTYFGEAIMRAASTLRFASAVANPGIAYIDIEDAGSDLSEVTLKDLITVDSDTSLVAFNADMLGIKEDKNEYVADQIFESMNVTCEHIYGDCIDEDCNFCGESREAPGHVYDSCEDIACNVCGALREAQKHVYDEDCTDATCNNCGKIREAESAHKYDDCEDTDCNNEGCKVTRTAPGHTFGEWVILKDATFTEEGEKQRTCTECGYTETAVIEKLVAPTPDDEGREGVDEPADDGDSDDEDRFPILLLCLMLLLVLVLICVDVWFVFIKKQTVTEPVEEMVKAPVEEEEEIDVNAALELVVLPDEDEFEGGVEVIEVIWAESSSKKVYRYDPNGMKVERGDIIRVPSRDAAKNRDVIRKVIVARGNHKVDPETLKHPLKKVDSVVNRYADTSAEDANN